MTSIYLFRNDLRLKDNRILNTILTKGKGSLNLLPMYCLDPRFVGVSIGVEKRDDPKTFMGDFLKTGPFRYRFLMESLIDLSTSLQSLDSQLLILDGRPEILLNGIFSYFKSINSPLEGVYYQKQVSSEELLVEKNIKSVASKFNVPVYEVWDSTLYDLKDLPWDAKDCPDVFTAFRKSCESQCSVQPLWDTNIKKLPKLPNLHGIHSFLKLESHLIHSCIDDKSFQGNPCLALQSKLPFNPSALDTIAIPDSRHGITFKGGETVAWNRLKHYLWDSNCIQTYKETRNGSIGMDYSTKLSPYLSMGCISPRSIYWEIKKYEKQVLSNESTYWVIFELLWRDYWKVLGIKYGNGMFYLHGPLHLRDKNATDRQWKHDSIGFKQWRMGQTGIPFVDAAMRELNATGFMSNRLRQNVASFLTHSLHIDWRLGAAYFESVLIDHDVESNYGNWQYVAGIGTDPRQFRKFNMIKQAQDYDPEGAFVQLWIPELRNLERGSIGLFKPWLNSGGIPLAYPPPLVIEKEWDKYPSCRPLKKSWSIRPR